MNPAIENEIAARLSEGQRRLTVAAMTAEFAALGYAVDRTMDCHCVARYMTGPRAGQTHPCTTTGLREADTGRSAFHFEARRDAAFERMQALRMEVFAITRNGSILEV